MPRPITVQLIGGLGDQLFGYYAGAALAASHGASLRLGTSWTRHGITDHGVGILDFELPGEWLSLESWPTRLAAPGTLPGRALAKAVREMPALGRPFRIHQAPGAGHDASLLQQPAGTRLRGYFQSWRIVEYAVHAGYPRRPNLRHSSDWLQEMAQRSRAEGPVGVHVRRGDYAHVEGYTLLGPYYYEAAIEAVRARGVSGPIWLFSDEPQDARAALGRYAGEAELIVSPDGSATEMLAFSSCKAHVIANSTFSWWGAWMNGARQVVMAPKPWSAPGPSTDDIIPPRWHLVPASP